MNWRGQTLDQPRGRRRTIAATTTRTGLTVHAELDHDRLPKGIKITDKQMRDLESTRHRPATTSTANGTTRSPEPRHAEPG